MSFKRAIEIWFGSGVKDMINDLEKCILKIASIKNQLTFFIRSEEKTTTN